MTDSLLNGFCALDLTDHKGYVCGQIMAMMGIDVIKVENPLNEAANNLTPLFKTTTGTRISLYWSAFNTDKRSITLNLESKQGQELFKTLVSKVDFIIESFDPGYLDKRRIGYDTLRTINPRIILTSISHFGQKGPYSHFKGSELVDAAMSGILQDTGYPDRAPVKESLDSCYYHANIAAVLGTILSHYHREISGNGQHVDVSIQEVATSRATNSLLAWIFDKKLLNRSWGQIGRNALAGMQRVWKCKDGHVFWMFAGGLLGAPANKALSNWMDDEGLINPLKGITNWDTFDMASMSQETREIYQKAIGNFFLFHTKKELSEEGLKRGINCAAVCTVADVLADNIHLKFHDFWANIDYPELQQILTYPKYLFLSNKTENYIKNRAPKLGEHNNTVYGEIGLTAKQIDNFKKDGII